MLFTSHSASFCFWNEVRGLLESCCSFSELSIGSGDFSGRVPSREPEMGMRSTVLRPMTALGQFSEVSKRQRQGPF